MDFRDSDSLETIIAHIGWLLKVGKYITSLAHSKFARVCIKINLAKPLKKGLLIKDEEH